MASVTPVFVSRSFSGRVFFDMDGVLADFESGAKRLGLSGENAKLVPGIYRELPPISDGLLMANSLLSSGVDAWIATKPPHANPLSATEKLQWVEEHLPAFIKRTIITPHKGMLSTSNDDVLIDDRPHKASIDEFQGLVIPIGPAACRHWGDASAILLDYLSLDSPRARSLFRAKNSLKPD